MGLRLEFYILKRDILRTMFNKLEKEDNFISFQNYIIEKQIEQQRVNHKTYSNIIIEKIKTNTLLLRREEIGDIKDYIYNESVGRKNLDYNNEDIRFVERMKQFGFELIHEISHGCASTFFINFGDSDSFASPTWDDEERDSINLTNEEFKKKLDYMILINTRIQVNDCNDIDDKTELISTIKNLEKNDLLRNVVESHFESAIEDENLTNNSWSILSNAVKLYKKVENINDGIVILDS